MLMAAVIAQAGYNPLVILIPGHAFIGMLMKDESMTSHITHDSAILRNLVELNELVVLETTMLTKSENGLQYSFAEAMEKGKQNLYQTDRAIAYDIAKIWSSGVRPIGTERPEDAPSIVNETTADGKQAEFLPEMSAEDWEKAISLVNNRKRTRMENWQLKLLDLSMRNNLLNSRTDKTQIHIVLNNSARLEDDLNDGKVFKLSAVPRTFALDEAIKKEDKSEANAIINQHALEIYEKNELLAASGKGLLDNEELQKRLYRLYLAARKNLEESGYNTLYIACGFLKWIRKDKNQTLYAPLLLIPVRISRKSVKSGFTLRTADEETRINLTLLELLKTEYSLRIPELEGELPTDKSGLDVPLIFDTIRRKIKDIEGWEILDTCSLGIFSFAKYLMWKDLCDRKDELMANPIVRHLADENRENFPAQVGFPDPATIDTDADAQRIYTPLSSDSSQLSAILAAGRGKNFVLIGPPGTGKSQTISNMIAHCLGHGKTVLFVAEKSAALSVVYKRLKRIGLGDFCLELHSNKAIKKEVLNQFKTAIDNSSIKSKKSQWSKHVNAVQLIREVLNILPRELHTPYPDGTTLYEDICRLSDTQDFPLLPPPSTDMMTISAEQKNELLTLAHELSISFVSVAHLYPGVANYLKSADYSLQWDDDLAEQLPRFIKVAEKRDAALSMLMNSIGLTDDDYNEYRHQICKLLLLAARTQGQDNTLLMPETAEEQLLSLKDAVAYADNYRRYKEALSLPYPEHVEQEPIITELYQDWKEAQFSNCISRFFTTRRIRKELQKLAFSHKTPDIGKDLERLIVMREILRATCITSTDLPHFRHGVNTQQSDYEAACAIADELKGLHDIQPLCRLYLTREGNPFIPGSPATIQVATLQIKQDEYATIAQRVSELMGTDVAQHPDFTQEGAITRLCNELLSLRKSWRAIVLWNACALQAKSKTARAMVDMLQRKEVQPDELESLFLKNYSRYRLRAAVDASKTLTAFDSTTHEARISDFREKDTTLLTAAGAELQQILRVKSQEHSAHGKELAELNHEINKQRAHKAIRKLFTLTPNVSRLLKPCMLMSPLSVAQYLTPDAEPFDVVIFDEASQIPVWDAIGAIGRGKSAVIVGDPRQMPPTSFFSRAKTEESEEEEEIEQDLESILDECLACGIPQMNLTWHYRSKSESLIAYSNRNYYENKLVTFPAPVAKDTALQYHYVQGTYERGSSKRYNKKEAQALVDHVLQVLRSPGFEYNEMTSIGIVTFNTQQQALILDLFEKARAADESLEPYFDEENPEAIFVKNLENVQGDERGVIYFSTTYGPDEKGNISMNFGPLNLTGGERRLNVAITRARTGMRVFSSLKPEDIDLNRTRARGAADLRGFLECARMGANAYFNTAGATAGQAESGLQHSICSALQAMGWNCVSNLGVSGFRIDIAIADPSRPGNMLAGIVLDGPNYAGAATARDRDVLRESVLQALGWNLCHIWALDWWRDPQGYAEKMNEQLKKFSAQAAQ